MLTYDELKRIAIQCGLDYSYTKASLRKFANAIRADEREACAKLCEELRDEDGYEAWNTECAAAIRARKEKE